MDQLRVGGRLYEGHFRASTPFCNFVSMDVSALAVAAPVRYRPRLRQGGRVEQNQAVAPQFQNRVRSAVFWRSGSQIAAQLIMWASTIIVVRLLDPHDYGVFAMSQVVVVLLSAVNGYAFATALIHAESVTRERIAQVFGVLIVLNVGLAAVQFAGAPLAAAYFHQPALAGLLRWQVLLYLATPLIALNSALLARELDFRKQAMANLLSAVLAALVGLGCAMTGWGIWTLVAAPVTLFVARGIGLAIASGILIMPSFRLTGATPLMRFGGALLISQFFWILQSQADILIAGRSLPPPALGVYAEGLFLTLIFTSKFIPPLNEVAFPAYVNLARRQASLAPAFLASVRVTMFVAMPLYLGMAVTAKPLIETVFGPKWLAMAPIIAGLAPPMALFTLQIICSPATNALGRPRIYIATSIAGATIMPIAFLFGSHYFGLPGLIHAWQIGMPILLIYTLWLTLPAVETRLVDLVRVLAPSALAAGAMAAAVFLAAPLVQGLPVQAALAVLVTMGGAIYLALLWRFSRATLAQVVDLIIRRRPDTLLAEA